MVEQVWVWPLGCVNIFLNQGALDGMQFCIMIRHDLWAFLITSDCRGPRWEFQGEMSQHWCIPRMSQIIKWWLESTGDGRVWTEGSEWHNFFLFSCGAWLLLVQNGEQMSELKKTKKKRYTCWAQASRLLFWWTYSRSDHTRVVLFILYCYEYLKSSACLLKQFF